MQTLVTESVGFNILLPMKMTGMYLHTLYSHVPHKMLHLSFKAERLLAISDPIYKLFYKEVIL